MSNSKAFGARLSRVSIPLALGLVGSLAYVVWSQKPLTQPVEAAVAPVATSASEVEKLDPFQPIVIHSTTVMGAPVSAAPASVINNNESSTTLVQVPAFVGDRMVVASAAASGNNPAAPFSVSVDRWVDRGTGNSSSSDGIKYGNGVGAATGSSASIPHFTVDNAVINVGHAEINVLSSFKLNYGGQTILTGGM